MVVPGMIGKGKHVRADLHISLLTAGLTDCVRLDVELHSPPDLVHSNSLNSSAVFVKKIIKGRNG